MDNKSAPVLKMRNISKEFYGNKVLNDINLTLQKGEIMGLVGENGAGKSTLMNILFGMDVIQQTGGYKGEMFVDGKEVHYTSSFDAINDGIGMVHQEFSLLPEFNVAENSPEPKIENIFDDLYA